MPVPPSPLSDASEGGRPSLRFLGGDLGKTYWGELFLLGKFVLFGCFGCFRLFSDVEMVIEWFEWGFE